MKTFVFKVTIQEGNDEFWESLDKLKTSKAMSDVAEAINDTLNDAGFEVEIENLEYHETYN